MSSAWVSACGRPPGAVTASPTISPSLTMTQPTEGLVRVSPVWRRDNSSARVMNRRSSAAPVTASGLEPGIAGDLGIDFGNHLLEILRVGEIPIDRCVADEGNVIEALQRLEHLQADFFGRDLVLSRAFQPADDAGDRTFDTVIVNGPLAQCDLEGSHQLVAVERHLAARLLGNHQLAELHALEGGEAPPAIRADAPPADGGVVLRRTRILDLRVFRSAIGAAHRFSSNFVM